MRHMIRRPSPAMVVACLALLFGLGGTSVAAVSQLVPRNSVGTAQLRDNAVARVKVRNNAINSAKVANRSLLAVDFARGQLPAGPAGPEGPAGPTGAAGAAGPAGPPGVSGYEIVESAFSVTDQYITSHTVNCPTGKRALGGGVRNSTLSFQGPYLVNSFPTVGGGGWTASFAKETQASYTYTVYVICGVVT